jgi:hypothetical protein
MAIRSVVPSISVIGDINKQIQEDSVDINLDKSFKFVPDFGDLRLTGGNIVFVTELDNLKQWISKTLAVALGYYQVYNIGYGHQTLNLIASQESRELIETLFPEFIREALQNDNRIIGIDRFVVTVSGGNLTASFRVHTINFDFFNYVTSVVVI